MHRRIITLTTDFGYSDPYVGIMKGVILAINPEARIIDISHGVRPYSIIHGAYVLLASYKWFPQGSIHVVVVDPGVGTGRRALIIKTRNYLFVGPDNGVLSWAAREDGVAEIIDASLSEFRLPNPSHTFHGRDVFAPIAAWLSLGFKPKDLGEPVGSMVTLKPPRCEASENTIETEVIVVDGFGNLILGCRGPMGLKPGMKVLVSAGGRVFQASFTLRFADVPPGQTLLHVNSLGFLEVSVNMGNASVTTGLKEGDEVWLKRS